MFSYIITYRAGGEIREKNLQATLRYIRASFDDAQIVLVEQDSAPRATRPVIRETRTRYVFVYNPNQFNRGWGYNVGVAYAKYGTLIMGTHDFAVPKKTLLAAIRGVNHTGAVSPFNEVVEMREETSVFFWERQKIAYSNDLLRHEARLTEGVILMTRNAFLEIGGWDENVTDEGAEDSLMRFKAEMLTGFDLLPGIGYHLFDAPPNLATNQTKWKTDAQFDYVEQIKEKNSEELEEYCQVMANGNGNPFKYKRKSL